MNRKPLIIGIVYGVCLASLTALNALDTFVIPHEQAKAQSENFDIGASSSIAPNSSKTSGTGVSNSSKNTSMSIPASASYEDSGTKITFEEFTFGDDKVPYALMDVRLANAKAIRTKLSFNSNGAAGSGITESFRSLIGDVASQHPKLAVNGCYPYWPKRDGYVISNGNTYRSSKRKDASTYDDFAIFEDGTALAYSEDIYTIEELEATWGSKIWQNWCFGPALLRMGQYAVTVKDEVDESAAANQRVAVGYIEPLHFVFLVANYAGDGRWHGAGLSLYDVATILKNKNALWAYNLDGGDSTACYCQEYGKSGGYYIETSRNLGDIVYVV